MASTPSERTLEGDGPPGRPDAIRAVERVVAIGSSAGGLDALSELLASLPTDLAIAYVVAQHQSPDHTSQLVPLLSKTTTMAVVEATEGSLLRVGVVFVAPPHTDVTIDADIVRVSEPGPSVGPKPSIDVLMRSVAASWGDRAVGVVLSGTGSDGSAGLRAIRDAGGLTCAQLPESAQFDAMPRAAIATGAVDLVVAPEQVGAVLGRTPAALETLIARPDRAAPTPGSVDVVTDVVAALHFATGLDFTDYKRGTLERQIARRQSLIDCPDAEQYCALVAEGGDEAQALGRSLLVTVTSFFRDSSVWDALAEVLTSSWAGRDRDRPVRVWVPGCATGEEAYTAAMVVADVLDLGAALPDRVKVFATDLSDSALDIARRGRYSDDAASAIPERLREHWTRRVNGDVEVIPALREAIVFARHNVAQDPPFPRIDLISLRNILIYFTAPLQVRALSFCHFALAPGGVLLLGQSERPTGRTTAFDVLDDGHRIYRRSATPLPAPLPVPLPEPRPTRREVILAPRSADRVVLRDALVDRFTPPALVVDANDDVIEVIGDVSPWCWVAPGEPSTNVLALLREELRLPARSLLIQARHHGADRTPRAVITPSGDARLEARQLGPEEHEWALLTFTRVAPDPVAAPASEDAVTPADEGEGDLSHLRDELDRTRQALQATSEDLSASNEQLRAMNEELQASAEELQASSEEVQATNEELQATNEELTVLNTELRVRAADLTSLNGRMENIQDSLNSGMVVVDRQLRVTQFTPLAVRLFVMIEADLGVPLTAITTTVPVPDLELHLRASIEQGARSMVEISGDSGDYLVAFQPFLQNGEKSGEAIVVISDITRLTAQRRQADGDAADTHDARQP